VGATTWISSRKCTREIHDSVFLSTSFRLPGFSPLPLVFFHILVLRVAFGTDFAHDPHFSCGRDIKTNCRSSWSTRIAYHPPSSSFSSLHYPPTLRHPLPQSLIRPSSISFFFHLPASFFISFSSASLPPLSNIAIFAIMYLFAAHPLLRSNHCSYVSHSVVSNEHA
jgi:hypothetical protein